MRYFAAALSALLLMSAGNTYTVDQARGVDQSVDYASLANIGPWDDRNYQLTADDIALLADNEHEQREGIPVFYRVQLRKQFPELRRTGIAQYPRSGLPRYLIEHGGFLIDGKVYQKAQREGKRWHVLTEAHVGEQEADGSIRMLETDVRVTSPTGAAEASIEISPTDPNQVVAGSNGPGSGQKMHYSVDGGQSWNPASSLPLGGTCCDPTVAWNSDGTLVYAATLGNQNYIYRSADGGQTWSDFANEPGGDPRREVSMGGFVDKEFLHVDISPTSPFQDNVYLTWHENNVMRFARSTDNGHTWSTLALPGGSSLLGIGSDIATDRAGNIYYAYPAFNSRTIRVAKSTNGGLSFGSANVVDSTQASFIFPIPSTDTREVFVYNAIDTDRSNGPFADSIYVSWTDSTGPTSFNPNNNHARIQVAYSRNGGSSWTTVTPHTTADANSVDRWHQWLAVDPNGNVHIVYYDTTGDSSRSSVNLYYQMSDDGGVSWTTPERLTSQTSPEINDSFEFGDYNGLSATLDHVIAVFTDNRNEGGGSADSIDIYAAGKAIGGGTGGGISCDVETTQASYGNGEQITLATLRYTNLSGSSLDARLRLQISYPSFGFTGNLIDAGNGGGLTLPDGFDSDFGPIPLFTVNGTPTGTWEFRCAIEDPFGGGVLTEDVATFTIN